MTPYDFRTHIFSSAHFISIKIDYNCTIKQVLIHKVWNSRGYFLMKIGTIRYLHCWKTIICIGQLHFFLCFEKIIDSFYYWLSYQRCLHANSLGAQRKHYFLGQMEDLFSDSHNKENIFLQRRNWAGFPSVPLYD